jgi:hypothetical protein
MKKKKESRPTRPDSDRARRAHVRRSYEALQARQFSLTMTTPRCIGSLPNHSMRPYATSGSATTIS